MHRRIHIILLAVAGALWLAAPAAAQFETPSRQFHEKTSFRLEGRHLAVPCESCHLNGVYKGTPTKCMDCHWTRRQDDRFRLQLGSQCEQCHTPVSWTSARFDHGAITGMQLSGAHRALACQSCHTNGNFRTASSSCLSCHQKDYQAATNPNHVAGGFPTTCDTCHRASDTSFNQAHFDHQASFPLLGQHVLQACAACHQNNVFRGTSRDCVGCHRVDYNRTTSPAHAAAGFPTTCESCHRATDASFKGATFNHSQFFALVGVHAQQACAACHVNNVYTGTARDCVGCHRAQYDRTTSPPHAASGFSTSCESCHRATDASFSGAVFNHSTFALVGVHAQQACAACHINNVYKGTARDCVGCHRTNYDRTTSPNHAAAGFPATCDSCHRATDSTWAQGTFNHTQFPITSGNHNAPCATCHTNPASYQSFTCLTCHEHSQSAMDSAHRGQNGYRYDSLACYSCHPTGRGGQPIASHPPIGYSAVRAGQPR